MSLSNLSGVQIELIENKRDLLLNRARNGLLKLVTCTDAEILHHENTPI